MLVVLAVAGVFAAASSSASAAPEPCSKARAAGYESSDLIDRVVDLRPDFYEGDIAEMLEVSATYCRDLTGDGSGEMIVVMGCCTGETPTPWGSSSATLPASGLCSTRHPTTTSKGVSDSVPGTSRFRSSLATRARSPTCYARTRFGGTDRASEASSPARTTSPCSPFPRRAT